MLQIHDDTPSWRATRTGMKVLSVTQVAQYLHDALEADPVLGDIWVSGEMSNVSRSSAGHLYFTLKDGGGQLRCVMFRDTISPVVVAAVDGAAVVAHGRFSFYELRGDLQLKVDYLMPQGQGPLDMEFQRLKAKLEAEGLFEETRKRSLPQFPRRIAIITSPRGAVLQDILNILRRRYPLVEVLLLPVAVQGDSASATIVAAFRTLQRRGDVDAIILARGGGTLEELWPFNEEATARAVYSSRAPVISAVGHETDYTIADFVADVRAPTPSAAAELVVPNRVDLHARLAGTGERLRRAMERQLNERRALISQARLRRPDFDRERLNLDYLMRRGLSSLRAALAADRSGLERCTAALSSLDPQRTLERGYAVVHRSPSGTVVRRAEQVTAGDALTVQVSDGSFGAVVTPLGRQRSHREKPVPQDQLALFTR